MKNKVIKRLLCMTLAASLMAGSGMAALAKESAGVPFAGTEEIVFQRESSEESIDLTKEPLVDYATGWGQFHTDGKNADGKQITLWDGEKAVEYQTGIGVHAFGSSEMAKAVYDISGYGHNVFKATAGVDYNSDSQNETRGTCEFKVYLDGEEVYASGVVNRFGKALEVSVLIPEGTKTLMLAVTNGNGNNNADWADWANPRLEYDAEAEYLFGSLKADIGKAELEVGEEAQITAEGRYINGEVIENMAGFCTFTSSNEAVASADGNGKVTAKAEGAAEITVRAAVGELVKTVKVPVVVLPSLEAGWRVTSPNGRMEFILVPAGDGSLQYVTLSDGRMVIQPSALGLNTSFGEFRTGLTLEKQESREINETYDMISGKKSEYVNHCRETTFTFKKEGLENVSFKIIVRAYDDGIAYRYALDGEGELRITDEYSSFRVPAESKTTVLEYGSLGGWFEDAYAGETIADADGRTYNMPYLYRTQEDKWVLITEAALSGEYTGAVLKGNGNELKVRFTPTQTTAVETTAPWQSPWRTAVIGGAKEIVENTMTENLSPACRIEDTSWIKPGTTSWTWYVSPGYGPQSDPELIKNYIDVAAEFGWKYYLMDEGWQGTMAPGNSVDGDWHKWVGIPDWLDEVVAYGKEKGVGIMAWVHSKDIDTPKEQEFFKELHDHGVVGMKIDFFDEESQNKLKLYERMYELAAEYHMLIDIHGCNKPTGENRTWPNLLTREGVRGQEFDDNRARLNVYLAYTRTAVGPTDYNPAVDLKKGGDTTASHNTALNIVYESGLPCPSDKGETYKKHHLVSLIENLPASWDETRFIGGDPDSYATFARRNGEDWYVGSISTDARREELALDFLGDGAYTAYIYQDGADRWDIDFSMKQVTAEDTLTLSTGKNGGYTLKFVKGELGGLEGVEISENELTLKAGDYRELKANGNPEKYQNDLVVEWESSNDAIASVDEDGRVTAHKVGTAYITAKAVLPVEGAEEVVSEPCRVTVEMDDLQISKAWTRNNPDPKMEIHSETSITLYPFQGEINNAEKNVKNYMTLEEQSADRDFILTLKCRFAPEANYQTAGITITTEDSGMLGMWRRYHSSFGNHVFGLMKHTEQFDETYQEETQVGSDAWLKLEKVGNNFTGYYSYDKENWTRLATKSLDLGQGEKIQIAVMTFAGSKSADSNIPAVLEDFTYNGEIIPFAEKPEEEEVTGVTSPADLKVSVGTEAEALELPAYLTVQLEDGTETDVSVAWDYSSYRKEEVGTYEIVGTLAMVKGLKNSAGVEAKVNVSVKPDDREAAAEVIEKINAIGKVTSKSKEAVEAARAAYEALDETAKSMVTNLDVLKAAEAELAKILEFEDVFDDVNMSDWFYDSVYYVYSKGVMTGYKEKSFHPYGVLARAQFAVTLYRMNGEEEVEYTDKFPDVAADTWYTNAILWASAKGVVTGYGEAAGDRAGYFGPADNIQRQQMAVMLYRYAKLMKYDTDETISFEKYLDADKVDDYAEEAMKWAVGSGIISGKEEQTMLDPAGNTTRAECAVMLQRFMEKYE